MDEIQHPTLQDAVRFALEHEDTLDYNAMISGIASQQPYLFWDIMERIGVSPVTFAAEFAKRSPAAFIDTAERSLAKGEGSHAIVEILKTTNNRVAAIKKIREIFGLGLFDSKSVADALGIDLDAKQFHVHAHLTTESREALRTIRYYAKDLMNYE